MIASQPKEECDMEPQESCRFITKMVPHLRAREECVEVPQEVCGKSRAVVKKERPAIMNWCYKPGKKPSFLASSTPAPPTPANSSQVLLKEVQFQDLPALASGADLASLGEEISIELFGEKTEISSDAVTCSFSFDDFKSFNSSIINDKELTLSDKKDLGDCYRVNSYRQHKKSFFLF